MKRKLVYILHSEAMMI